jgi:hypothetical protein
VPDAKLDDKDPVKNFNCSMTDELHRAIKIYAASHDLSMARIVIEAVATKLKIPLPLPVKPGPKSWTPPPKTLVPHVGRGRSRGPVAQQSPPVARRHAPSLNPFLEGELEGAKFRLTHLAIDNDAPLGQW